jgi:hypothetical protein
LATLTVGGSNATRLAEALANLEIDSYKLTAPGWKLNKEYAEKITPDLKEVLETIPKEAPVVFFCLDGVQGCHSGGRTHKHFKMRGGRRWISNQIKMLKVLVSYCEGRTVGLAISDKIIIPRTTE